MVTGADAAAVDAVIGAGLAGQAAARGPDSQSPKLVTIAVDGKTVRGATATCTVPPKSVRSYHDLETIVGRHVAQVSAHRHRDRLPQCSIRASMRS